MTNTYYGAIWTRYNTIPEPQVLKLRRELGELRRQIQELKGDSNLRVDGKLEYAKTPTLTLTENAVY